MHAVGPEVPEVKVGLEEGQGRHQRGMRDKRQVGIGQMLRKRKQPGKQGRETQARPRLVGVLTDSTWLEHIPQGKL